MKKLLGILVLGLLWCGTVISAEEQYISVFQHYETNEQYVGVSSTVFFTAKENAYKRTLAECFVNGESLSKFLVRSGYAFAYRKYSTKFVKDEEFAKANKLGMWAMTFQYPWDFRNKK